MDIPSTSVIKHWVAWGVTADCPDDYMEHDPERVKQFEAWLAEVKAKAWEEGYNSKWVETYFYDNPYRQGESK